MTKHGHLPQHSENEVPPKDNGEKKKTAGGRGKIGGQGGWILEKLNSIKHRKKASELGSPHNKRNEKVDPEKD